jgi:prepilin-type N-terminal cleavage/methylation domain-containing protein
MNDNKYLKMSNLGFRAFSLVEVLAAVAIIGIITFLAMPNIVAVKQDSETNLAISRAEALNIALVTLLQSNGRENVAEYWEKSTTNQDRYALLASYLAFAPANLDQYMPLGYRIDIPNGIEPLSKVSLSGPRGEIIY